jgi:hypothetical protein
MPAEARRGLLIGVPVFIVAATGMALVATGDQIGSSALFAAGLCCFGVAFLVWMVVVLRLTVWASPSTEAWNKAFVEGPTANKFNTVICSVMLIGGVVLLLREPSPFGAVFVAVVAGMLVRFIRRGWPRQAK